VAQRAGGPLLPRGGPPPAARVAPARPRRGRPGWMADEIVEGKIMEEEGKEEKAQERGERAEAGERQAAPKGEAKEEKEATEGKAKIAVTQPLKGERCTRTGTTTR
jgi:hypothetical protein